MILKQTKNKKSLITVLLLLSMMFSPSILLGQNGHFYQLEGPFEYNPKPAPEFIQEKLGNFGPREKNYTVPDNSVIVSPKGKESNSGSSIKTPTTLEKAIKNAQTGDVIVLRGGTYRTGDLSFGKEITIQPYKNEKPVIKGSKEAHDWKKVGDNWKTSWETLFPKENRGKVKGQKCLWNGDRVFLNGKMLVPVSSLDSLKTGKCFVDYEKKEVYITDSPRKKLVEITAYNSGFRRIHDEKSDSIGPTIQGLTLMHYAGTCILVQGNDVYGTIIPGAMPDAPVGTKIIDNRILFSADKGLYIISPESYIGYNEISLHNHLGMMIRQAQNSIMEHNIISEVNMFGLLRFPAGVNIFNQSSNFLVRNNYFYGNNANALWYDVGHHNGIVVNNYFKDNVRALKVEISHRVNIISNVMDKSNLRIANASNNVIMNNTFIGSKLHIIRNNRGLKVDVRASFNHNASGPGLHGYIGHKIANNVFCGKSPVYFQHGDRNEYIQYFSTTMFANNLFTTEADNIASASFLLKDIGTKNPGDEVLYKSLSDFKKDFGKYLTGNKEIESSAEELFESLAENDLRLKIDYQPQHMIPLPDEILKYLNVPEKPVYGAFFY